MTSLDSAVVEESATVESLLAALDDRTREVLARQHSTSTAVRRRGWLVRRALVMADVLGLASAFIIVQVIFPPDAALGDHVRPYLEYLLFFLTLPVWIIAAKLYGLYDHDEERTDHGTVDDIVGIFHMVSVGTWLLVLIASATQRIDPSVTKLVLFWSSALVLITLARACARALCRRQVAYLQNAIIVGADEVGQLVAHKVLQHREYRLNIVGFVDDGPRELSSELRHLAVLGSPSRLPALVRTLWIDRVIIAFSKASHERTLALIRSLKDLDVQIDIVPRLFELVSPGVGVHTVEGLPLISLPPLRLARSSRLLKRLMDLGLAIASLALLAPLFVFIALRIRFGSSGPVIFRQIRIGINGRPFSMYKFRTMTADADRRKAEFSHLNVHARDGGDPRMFKISNDPRVTRFGTFLRRYSLDELPQLINVVRGEMSLVGPRPLIPEEAEHVSDWARKRLALKPGMTGLWQVLGRSDIPFEEMTKLDYLYVTTWSFWGDLCLLFRTVPAIFRKPRTD
jgi:exopolysaccharide biosynthesis polyprenyl glycosylphosphotransferase